LAVPPGKTNQGSIALPAIRSVRSLARIGGWAQLKNIPPPDESKAPATVKEKSVKKKKTKEGDAKEEKGGESKSKKNKKNKLTKKENAQTVRLSSSSFEVGGLTASPEAPKTIGPKKHSILGLGLPSTMRLPTVRGSSTSSSVAPVANRFQLTLPTF
jgi:serine/arginine repetitive matrix protein 2